MKPDSVRDQAVIYSSVCTGVLNKANTGTEEELLLTLWVHLRLEADHSRITHSRRSPYGTAIYYFYFFLPGLF